MDPVSGGAILNEFLPFPCVQGFDQWRCDLQLDPHGEGATVLNQRRLGACLRVVVLT